MGDSDRMARDGSQEPAEPEQSPVPESSSALTRPQQGIDVLAAQAQTFARAAKAPSTLRAYAADWQHFVD